MMNNPYKAGVPYGGYPGYPPQGGMQYGGQMPSQMPNGAYMPPSGQVAMPSAVPGQPSAMPGQPAATPGQLPLEQSFIENILRLNLGKVATIYMTYENNSEWNAKVFKGRLEAAGRDHIIISDPSTGMRFLLLMVNLDYITFDEELKYTYPYGAPQITGR
ncbi:MAG: hypothetical protein K0S39_5517 [Paenibacillus sp.]|jgi:spore germination protein Q|nr:hypothetical protein [Paenibacillus sp.]